MSGLKIQADQRLQVFAEGSLAYEASMSAEITIDLDTSLLVDDLGAIKFR